MAINEEHINFSKVSDLPNPEAAWASDNTKWYVTDDVDSRTYTINQALVPNSGISYYYLSNNVFNTTEFIQPGEYSDKQLVIYINKYFINDDKTVVLNENSQTYTITAQNFANDSDSFNVNDIVIEDVAITVARNIKKDYDISNMTNGELWYNFHDHNDIPGLLEKIVMIETQLTTYWDQAYTASQYCQWFIPPEWRPKTANKENYFSSMLYYLLPNNKIWNFSIFSNITLLLFSYNKL